MFSSLGLMKEKPANAAWSMESMRFLSAWERRGFSLRNSRSKLLQSLADFCGRRVRDFSKFAEVIRFIRSYSRIKSNPPQSVKKPKSYHFWLEGWVHLSLLQCRPVDGFEERVGTDVAHHTQPASGISLKQLEMMMERKKAVDWKHKHCVCPRGTQCAWWEHIYPRWATCSTRFLASLVIHRG